MTTLLQRPFHSWNRWCLKVALCGAFLTLSMVGYGQDLGVRTLADRNSENLEISADFNDFDALTGVARASGDVIIKFGDVMLYADETEYSQQSNIIRATGDVRLFRGTQNFTGEEIFYDLTTNKVTASKIRSALEPFFYETDEIIIPSDSSQPITMQNASITTHDAKNPEYQVVARNLTVFPDEKVVIRGAKFKLGNRNILGIPYYVQPLKSELGFLSTPGWSSTWGAYILNRYGFTIGDNYTAQVNADYRSLRGPAVGLKLRDNRSPYTGLKLYYQNDKNPDLRFNGTRSTNNVVDQDRYSLALQQRVYYPGSDDRTLYVDFDINVLSDAFFVQDFDPNEFRRNPKPDNVIAATKLFDWGEGTIIRRFDFNDFFQTDTRTEAALDVVRTPIGNSKVFYNSSTSIGQLGEEVGDDSFLRSFVDPRTSYNRFHTYHEAVRPFKIGDWLNVVPRGGIGYTNYSNFDFDIDAIDRTLYHGGVDVSFKLSKKNPDIQNKSLGIDGILHVMQPYLNMSVTGVNELDGQFNAIDRNILTTQLRPIDPLLNPAIDSFADASVVRMGLANKWITRRDGSNWEWLSIDNFFESYITDPEFDRDFSNFFTNIRWNPVPWLSLESSSQIPLLNDSDYAFTEINSRLTYIPTDWFKFTLGHYYLNDHPFFDNADQYSLSTYTRLGDEWGFSTAHRYEADDAHLEYQQYAIHRDLRSWVARLGFSIRDNRVTDPEYGVFLGLTLKAFPELALPIDFTADGIGVQ